MARGTNYSGEKDTEENVNASDKYSPTGESEFSRESTIPFDQDEILSERHYSFTPMESIGRKRSRTREPRSEPSHDVFRGRGPKGYKKADSKITEDVCEALYRHTGVDASFIEVNTLAGVVTLKGTVPSREQKRLAEEAVEHIGGVIEVRNEISLRQNDSRSKPSRFGLTDNITGMN